MIHRLTLQNTSKRVTPNSRGCPIETPRSTDYTTATRYNDALITQRLLRSPDSARRATPILIGEKVQRMSINAGLNSHSQPGAKHWKLRRDEDDERSVMNNVNTRFFAVRGKFHEIIHTPFSVDV